MTKTLDDFECVRIGDATLYLGDCLEIMPLLKAGSVDMVLADPPYGTTQCKWDAIIPFKPMWAALKHLTVERAAVVMTATQPFTSALVSSNYRDFRYTWVWDKVKGTGFLNAKKMPMRNHEDVVVFYRKLPKYNPQKTTGHPRKTTYRGAHLQTDVYGDMKQDYKYSSTERYPRSVQVFSTDTQSSSFHPTQKPIAMLEYMLATYSDEADTVLDFTMGSGSTGVACYHMRNKFIGIEKEEKYFDVACKRIRDAYANAVN